MSFLLVVRPRNSELIIIIPGVYTTSIVTSKNVTGNHQEVQVILSDILL